MRYTHIAVLPTEEKSLIYVFVFVHMAYLQKLSKSKHELQMRVSWCEVAKSDVKILPQTPQRVSARSHFRQGRMNVMEVSHTTSAMPRAWHINGKKRLFHPLEGHIQSVCIQQNWFFAVSLNIKIKLVGESHQFGRDPQQRVREKLLKLRANGRMCTSYNECAF
mmetsp:Transcript_45165/g.125287  ORF Transcript_45165/g.125287 Transcript_45165/m.125287 type:complete len:164 (+) Transcript_45165:723-1214(+)